MALTQPNLWQPPKPAGPVNYGNNYGMGSQSQNGLMSGGYANPLRRYNASNQTGWPTNTMGAGSRDPVSGLPMQPPGTQPTSVQSSVPVTMGMDPQQSQTYQPPASESQVNYGQPWDNPNYQEPTPPDASMYSGQGAAMQQADQNRNGPAYGDMTQSKWGVDYNPTKNYSTDMSSFNTQYATPDNVNQYMNPFLNSIMDRGNKALSNWNPQSGTSANTGAFGLNGYNPSYTQANRMGAQTQNLGAYGVNGYDPSIGPQVNRQAATMDNLNAYADPSYQFRLQQGVNGLDASAAAKGGLLSSGHMKDLTDYSQGLASTEYQNMYNRFNNDQNNIQNDQNTRNNFAADQTQNMFNRQNIDQTNRVGDANNANNFASGMLNDQYARASGDRSFGQGAYQNDVNNGMWAMQNAQGQFNNDRNYMTNNYWDNRNADTADNHYNNNFNWDQYKYGNADFQGKLGDYYNGNQAIDNTGLMGVNSSGQLTSNYADALAQLYGQQGNTSAAQIQGMGNQNQGMISNILKLIGGV